MTNGLGSGAEGRTRAVGRHHWYVLLVVLASAQPEISGISVLCNSGAWRSAREHACGRNKVPGGKRCGCNQTGPAHERWL